VVVAEAQLLLGAHHPLGAHPADFGRLEGDVAQLLAVAVNETRTDGSEGDLQPGPLHAHVGVEVGGTGHHGQRLPGPVVHRGQDELVGVGVRPDLQDLADENLPPVPVLTDPLDSRHLQAGHGHAVGQFINGQDDVYVFFEP